MQKDEGPLQNLLVIQPSAIVALRTLDLGCSWEQAKGRRLFVGCLTSQQHASVSQERIYSDNFTCCHTEIGVADQTFHLPQSQYTDSGPTSPSADPITPGAWLGSLRSANFEVTGMTRPRKNPVASGIRTRDLPLSGRTPYPLGQRGGPKGRGCGGGGGE